MQFNQLNQEICDLTPTDCGHISLFIRTPDGTITLNETMQRKAASIAKLFILTEAFRQAEKGLLKLDDSIVVDQHTLVGGSGVIRYLTNPPVLRYQHLLELMMIVSDNTASNILLDTVGMENINILAEQIGCQQSRINRHFMDMQAQAEGYENYTSALDMFRLLNIYTKKNKFLSDRSRKHMLTILGNQQFQDKLPKFLEESDHVTFFHKTGELQGVEHDVAIIKCKGKVMEAAVLTEGWKNNGRGQQYIAEIGRLLIQYMSN